MKTIYLKIPKECFPRLCFASRNIQRIKERLKRMMKEAGSGRNILQRSEVDAVYIHIYWRSDERDIPTDSDIVKRNSNKVTHLINRSSKSIEDFSEIVILSGGLEKEDISNYDLGGRFTIYVARSTKHAHEMREELESTVSIFSTKETLASDIDDYLEHESYRPLLSYHTHLVNCQRDYKTKDIEAMVEFETPKAIQEEAIEQLLQEIMALFNVSNIPIEERPKHVALSDPVSNEVRKALFKICPTIKAVGYRFRKVHVYLEEIKNHEEIKERERKIAEFMDIHKIKYYSTSNVFGEIEELMSAGSEITARNESQTIEKSGTLGCFAEMEEENSKTDCILVSKHVVSNCKDVFLIDNGNERQIGEVIPTSTKHEQGSLDIAAAMVTNPEEVDYCTRKLKDSNGNMRKGKLDEYLEGMNNQIIGRQVYIWGSKTKPGKGIITDSNYFIDGMKAGLVEIKNEESYTCADETSTSFAKPGDSGSIVCSDDPDDKHVNAHAMLIGSNTETTHLAVPLKEGINQLEEMTRNKFTLFEG